MISDAAKTAEVSIQANQSTINGSNPSINIIINCSQDIRYIEEAYITIEFIGVQNASDLLQLDRVEYRGFLKGKEKLIFDELDNIYFINKINKDSDGGRTGSLQIPINDCNNNIYYIKVNVILYESETAITNIKYNPKNKQTQINCKTPPNKSRSAIPEKLSSESTGLEEMSLTDPTYITPISAYKYENVTFFADLDKLNEKILRCELNYNSINNGKVFKTWFDKIPPKIIYNISNISIGRQEIKCDIFTRFGKTSYNEFVDIIDIPIGISLVSNQSERAIGENFNIIVKAKNDNCIELKNVTISLSIPQEIKLSNISQDVSKTYYNNSYLIIESKPKDIVANGEAVWFYELQGIDKAKTETIQYNYKFYYKNNLFEDNDTIDISITIVPIEPQSSNIFLSIVPIIISILILITSIILFIYGDLIKSRIKLFRCKRNFKNARKDAIELAIECYKEIIKLDPAYSDAYCLKGYAHIKLREYIEAINCCNSVINYNPNYAKAYYYKGLANLRSKNYKDAIDNCNDAIRLSARCINAWETLNEALIKYESTFRLEDIIDPAGFAGELTHRRDPLSQYLKEQFSSKTKRQLHRYEVSRIPIDRLVPHIIDEFNRILDNDKLLGKLSSNNGLRDETKSLMGMEISSIQLLRLNRLILEDTYHNSIREANFCEADKALNTAMNLKTFLSWRFFAHNLGLIKD
jgi:tetratricopeptide (TPR) repeat protein